MRKVWIALAALIGGLLLVGGGAAMVLGIAFIGISSASIDESMPFFVSEGMSAETAMAAEEESMEMARDDMVAAEAPAQAEPATAKVAAAAPAAPVSTGFAAGALVIRNGALNMVVSSPASAVERIQQIIADTPGAFIANAEVRQAGDRVPTTLVLRVPAESFDAALAALRGLAQEVLAEQVTARDVTEEFTDVDARLRNLQAAEIQLLALVEQATDVEDLLQIERRMAEVRGEIERLQGRLNVLEDRIALATITVSLHAPPDLTVTLSTAGLPAAHAVTPFTLNYRNSGTVAARDVVLTMDVPERLSVLDVGQGGSFDPITREITWILADVGPWAEGRTVVHLRVENADSDISLGAAITATGVDADPDDNTAGLTLTFAPDLALDVESPPSGAEGAEVPIWVMYSNVGTADGTDVTIQALVPPGLTFVRADFGGSYDAERGAVEWKLGRVQAGWHGQVLMHVRVDVSTGRLKIPISISADQTDAVTFNNETEVFLTALREDVSDRDIWQPGQTVETSIAALVAAARIAVDAIIWLFTFGVPLAAIVLLGLGVRAGMRRLRRRGNA